jgi:hypothetical protein
MKRASKVAHVFKAHIIDNGEELRALAEKAAAAMAILANVFDPRLNGLLRRMDVYLGPEAEEMLSAVRFGGPDRS